MSKRRVGVGPNGGNVFMQNWLTRKRDADSTATASTCSTDDNSINSASTSSTSVGCAASIAKQARRDDSNVEHQEQQNARERLLSSDSADSANHKHRPTTQQPAIANNITEDVDNYGIANILPEASQQQCLEQQVSVNINNVETVHSVSKSFSITVASDLSRHYKDGPFQPVQKTYARSSFKEGDPARCFSKDWYAEFPCIEYSQLCDAVFCFTCRHFKEVAGSIEVPFVNTGFRNWKRLGEKLKKHIQSDSHCEAVAKCKAAQQSEKNGSVTIQISNHVQQDIKRNREAFGTVARGVLYCARQNIGLRGHNESTTGTAPKNDSALCHHEPISDDDDIDTNDSSLININRDKEAIFDTINHGNFLEVIELIKLESKEAAKRVTAMPRNATYMSKKSQEDILNAAVLVIRQAILDEMGKTERDVFSLIVDEARDNSCTEQMSICVRYISSSVFNKQSIIRERFLGFVRLFDLNADALTENIQQFFNETGISLKRCVSQAYDGATVMSGKMNGVQAKIRELVGNPCPYIHCHAHRLNLVLSDVCKNVEYVSDMFGLLEAIYAFQSVSTIRHAVFLDAQSNEERTLKLPQQSDTRWVCKHVGVQFFHKRFQCVIIALQKLKMSANKKEAAEAKGLLLQFKSIDTLFSLKLLDDLLSVTNMLSLQLQTVKLDFSACKRLIAACIKTLKDKRTDEYARKLWEEAAGEYEVQLPENSRHSKRTTTTTASLHDSVVMTTLGARTVVADLVDAEGKYRVKVFEVIDALNNELQRRFVDNSSLLDTTIACDPRSKSFLSFELLSELSDSFPQLHVNKEALQAQCVVGKNLLKVEALDSSLSVYNHLLQLEQGFPDLVKCFRLVLTIPISSASAERTFSAMRRIKTFSRASMSDNRLSNLAILAIERDLSYKLMQDPSKIIDEFVKVAGDSKKRLTLST